MDYRPGVFSQRRDRPEPREVLEAAWTASRSTETRARGSSDAVRANPEFWWRRAEAGLVQLINYKELVNFFGIARASLNKFHSKNPNSREFYSSAWKAVVASLFYEVYKFYSASGREFYASVRPPAISDLETMPPGGYPIFPSEQNRTLASLAEEIKESRVNVFGVELHPRGLEAEWLDLVSRLYSEWAEKFNRIHTVADPSGADPHEFQLGRSLGIGADQRVFRVTSSEGERAVVKWDSRTGRAIENWARVRASGTTMPQWSGAFAIVPDQPLLLTELLTPLGPSDNAYQMMRDVLWQLDSMHKAGLCHSDIKPENILRRADGSYSLIDFDSVSWRLHPGVPNALQRAASSFIWRSQIVGGMAPTPTSYRYDLEELYYAASDMLKSTFYGKGGSKYFGPVMMQFAAGELTLNEAVNYVRGGPHDAPDGFLELLDVIRAQPERLPFAEIDHIALIDRADRLIEETPYKNSPRLGECAHCGVGVHHRMWPLQKRAKPIGYACSLRCAVHQSPKQYIKQASRCAQLRVEEKKLLGLE